MDRVDEFLEILNQSINEIYIFDQNTLLFSWANESAMDNLQYSMHELTHMTPLSIKKDFNSEYFDTLLKPLSNRTKHKIIFETTHERKDRSRYDIEVHLQSGLFRGKKVYIATILDISEKIAQKTFLKALSQREKDLSRILNQSQNEIYIFNKKNLKFMWVNQKSLENLKHSLSELKQMTPLNIKPDHTLKTFQHLVKPLDENKEKIIFQTRHIRNDGSLYDVEVHLQTGIYQNTNVYVAIIIDITKRKAEEKLIKQLIAEKNHESLHDYTTKLPNRRALEKHLETETANRILNPGYQFAVIFIDLDNFKNINDTQGHQLGDKLLILVSERIGELLSKQDFLARFGGDEFVFVLSGPIDKQNLSIFCQNILSRLSVPFCINKMNFSLTASIGIALAPIDASTSDQLIQFADFAQYFAKQGGKNQFQFYAEKQHQKFINRAELISKIAKGIKNNEFSYVLQPIVDLQTQKITGAEVLMRWYSENEAISPAEFIPLLEETNTIHTANEWLLDEIFNFICEHQPVLPNSFTLCFNATFNEIIHSRLYERLKEKLNIYHLDSIQLEIEITEYAFAKNMNQAKDYLHKLKKLGIKISIDDFGTGYSCLQYLRTLPIDTLKIDKSFIDEIHQPVNIGIIKTIITLAETLKLDVVAEGIESVSQLNELLSLQSRTSELPLHGQGFLFHKPMPVEQFIQILSQP